MPTTTYEPIQTYTISGTSTNYVDFTSIPSTFTELKIVASIDSIAENDLCIQCNGDTTNYGYGGLSAYRTSSTDNTVGFKSTAYQGALVDYYGTPTASGLGQHLVHVSIADYTGSHWKIFYSKSHNFKSTAVSGVDTMVSVWKSNSAITSLRVIQASPLKYFTAGSKITLFGLKVA